MSNPSRIAQAFGLESLDFGQHYIRGAQRERLGSLAIRSVFSLQVKPSFHAGCTVWIVAVEGLKFRDTLVPSWIKAGLEAGGEARTIEISTNPLEPHLQSFNFNEKEGGVVLDGVGYVLSFHAAALKGELRFSNPGTRSLMGIEAVMFNLAYQILRQGGEGGEAGMLKAVTDWRSYIHR